MNFIVDHTEGSGTSLVGYVETTLDTLIKAFGEPQRWDEGDKVTTEWTLVFDDSTIATIYDWKRYELGAPESNELYRWHIGGNSKDAELRVNEVLGKVKV